MRGGGRRRGGGGGEEEEGKRREEVGGGGGEGRDLNTTDTHQHTYMYILLGLVMVWGLAGVFSERPCTLGG